MKFNIIWECDIGTEVSVSNGKPEPQPAIMSNKSWREWFSHNFTGTIAQKGGTSRRWIRFEIIISSNITGGYTIYEDLKQDFYSSNLNTTALALYQQELRALIDTKAQGKITPIDALLIYAKWQEVRDINATGLPAIQAMSAAEREARFPFFSAELVEDPSITPAEVLSRFTSQTTTKIAKAAAIEARRSHINRLITAAATQAEKEAAASTSWDDI